MPHVRAASCRIRTASCVEYGQLVVSDTDSELCRIRTASCVGCGQLAVSDTDSELCRIRVASCVGYGQRVVESSLPSDVVSLMSSFYMGSQYLLNCPHIIINEYVRQNRG